MTFREDCIDLEHTLNTYTDPDAPDQSRLHLRL